MAASEGHETDVSRDDPYRRDGGDDQYRRASRLARIAPALAKWGYIGMGLVWALAGGALLDGIPPLSVAVAVYVIGLALVLTPTIARVRIRSSRFLAAAPQLDPPQPHDVVRVFVGAWLFLLVAVTGALLILVYVSTQR